MDPIFEIAVNGRVREVRVGDDVYPTFGPYKFLGRSCTPAVLVEAPLAVGQQHGWTRRFDVELARKRRLQELGAIAAEMMRQADQEAAERAATEEAERVAAAERAERQREAAAQYEAEEARIQAERRAESERAREEREAAELLARLQAQGDSNHEVAPTGDPAAAGSAKLDPPPAPAATGRRNRGR